MASRDIANMHFFLDLKKKFPDLPDDLLRNHLPLFSEDQQKCIRLLQRESQKHSALSSPPFSDFRLPDGRRGGDGYREEIVRSMPMDSHSSVSPQPTKPEPRSAPVIQGNQEPFADMYRHASSQNSKLGQTMFLTTKEHKVGLPNTYVFRELPERSKRHTVRLSITPSLPYQQQQQIGDFAHSSRPGRHTTSVNFELQPCSSLDRRPFVISSIPASAADPGHSGSHVQISVGSRGATFAALRFQHESSQAQNSSLVTNKLPRSKDSSAQYRSAQPSPSYILAVQNEQIARLDRLVNALEREKALCSHLRQEVGRLQTMVAESGNAPFSYAKEVNELREENKRLRTECNCLYIETDTYGSNEIPPCETEDFYSQLFTGPNGTILPHTEAKSASREDAEEEEGEWVCKKCTFANHPALEKCEMCEVPKDIECFFPEGLPPRPAGSVQISITRSPKNLKFHLARKTER